MSILCKKALLFCNKNKSVRFLSKDTPNTHRCKLLIVGGGAGGCSVAWRFSRKLGKGHIIVLDPSDKHYYQPLFPLVAAGIRQLPHSHRPLASVLPPGGSVQLLRDSAAAFDPAHNTVITAQDHAIKYEHLVVAVGVVNQYDQIEGLKASLDDPSSGVSTIYSPDYCTKTWDDIRRLRGGHAIFTVASAGVKCAGAAQKIMYLADSYFRRHNVRSQINITYNTGGESLFGVEKYARALRAVAASRDIPVNYRLELVEVRGREAVFACMEDGHRVLLPFNMLHVAPPMSPPPCLTSCEALVDEAGYLHVDEYTLQHKRFDNVYGIGDCTSTPNSKTAAAVASQSHVLERNLTSTMFNKPPTARYDGYGACTMMTSYRRGILAEVQYGKKLCETFPFDQSKERSIFYQMNKHLFPRLYWRRLIRGKWDGPAALRRLINPLRR